MSAYAWYEYTATLSGTGHAENEGEQVHCVIQMDMFGANRRARNTVELEQEAGDLILFVVNPGPSRRIAHSKIWKVNEQRSAELGPPSNVHHIANSTIYFYTNKT